jgi:hypothetical protein
MKYDTETTAKLIADYQAGITVKEIAEKLTEQLAFAALAATGSSLGSEQVPERSVIAKLSSLGVYKKKEYLTKRGEVPVKKEEYIERIAVLLDVNSELLESLEKVNKGILALISAKLTLSRSNEENVEISDEIPQTVRFECFRANMCSLGQKHAAEAALDPKL